MALMGLGGLKVDGNVLRGFPRNIVEGGTPQLMEYLRERIP